MLVDTHAHIYHERFDADRVEVIERAFDAGVGCMILPAIDVRSFDSAIVLCNRYAGLYAMTAVLASETGAATRTEFDSVARYCEHSSVVAVGETGLDYYWDRTFDDRQISALRWHIQLAAEHDLPLVFHNREAGEDLVRILQEERETSEYPDRIRGVFHCFGGPAELIAPILSLGFHFGIGGTLTFKNSGVDRLVGELPLDRIVLETDAPFLAPVPHRGKRNEPAFVRLVAEKLAEVTGLELSEVERITTRNAADLFRLPFSP